MSKARFFLAGFLLSPCLMFAQGSIEGRVVNRITRGGVASAEVKVYAGRDLRYQVSTAPDGSFVVPQVPDGSYTVTASKDGFGQTIFGRTPPSAVVSGSR